MKNSVDCISIKYWLMIRDSSVHTKEAINSGLIIPHLPIK